MSSHCPVARSTTSLEAKLLKASSVDIRNVCVFMCPHALRKLQTYEAVIANDA